MWGAILILYSCNYYFVIAWELFFILFFLAFSLKHMNTWIHYWIMSVKSKEVICSRLYLCITNVRLRIYLKIMYGCLTFPVRKLKPRDIPCLPLGNTAFWNPSPGHLHKCVCVLLLIYSITLWLRVWILDPGCLGLNLSSTTY